MTSPLALTSGPQATERPAPPGRGSTPPGPDVQGAFQSEWQALGAPKEADGAEKGGSPGAQTEPEAAEIELERLADADAILGQTHPYRPELAEESAQSEELGMKLSDRDRAKGAQSEKGSPASPPATVRPISSFEASLRTQPSITFGDEPAQTSAGAGPLRTGGTDVGSEATTGNPAQSPYLSGVRLESDRRQSLGDLRLERGLNSATRIGPGDAASRQLNLAAASSSQNAKVTPESSLTPLTGSANNGVGHEPEAGQSILEKGNEFAVSQLSDRSVAPATSSAITAPSAGPKIAAQMAAAVTGQTNGTTEIALNPEELGRVRMTLSTADGGLTIAIHAERPETADLMRRNIEHLMREFRDMGHDNPTFTFDHRERRSTANQPGSVSGEGDLADAPVSEMPPPSLIVRAGGLDLKL